MGSSITFRDLLPNNFRGWGAHLQRRAQSYNIYSPSYLSGETCNEKQMGIQMSDNVKVL